MGAVSSRFTTSSSRSRCCAFFRYDITLNVIAAILTVTGAIADQRHHIVIFDQVREYARRCKGPLSEVINASINQTLGCTCHHRWHARCVCLLALFLFWRGEVLSGFRVH